MERIIVTGGLGFIGSNFIHQLFETRDDVTVTNVDYEGLSGNQANLKDLRLNKHYRFVKADIAGSRTKSLLKKADFVVHFAAETHVDRSIANPEPFLKSNLIGTFNVLEACRKNDVSKLIHISTDEVYGSISSESFSEQNSISPNNPYSAMKAGSDLLARAWNSTYDLPVVILRGTNNFGPYQHPEKLIPKIIIRGILGQAIPLYGGGGQVREWIYVRDFCSAIQAALEKGEPGEAYNISAGNGYSNHEVAERLLKQLGKSPDTIIAVEDRPGHDTRYSVSSEKASKLLDWRPKHEFDTALGLTAKWYLSNPLWWKSLATRKVLSPTPWKERW